MRTRKEKAQIKKLCGVYKLCMHHLKTNNGKKSTAYKNAEKKLDALKMSL